MKPLPPLGEFFLLSPVGREEAGAVLEVENGQPWGLLPGRLVFYQKRE